MGIFYYKDGTHSHDLDPAKTLHKEGGPAFIDDNGNVRFFFEGKLHNPSGPAVVYSTGKMEYWYNDNQYPNMDSVMGQIENEKLARINTDALTEEFCKYFSDNLDQVEDNLVRLLCEFLMNHNEYEGFEKVSKIIIDQHEDWHVSFGGVFDIYYEVNARTLGDYFRNRWTSLISNSKIYNVNFRLTEILTKLEISRKKIMHEELQKALES